MPSVRAVLTGFAAAVVAQAGCARLASTPSAPSPSPERTPAPVDGSECPPGLAVAWRGDFDQADWLERWDRHAKIEYGSSNAPVIGDARFGRVLRVLYPAGSSSSSYAGEGHPLGGLEFKVHLPEGGRSIFLSYWLRFAPGFDWVKGGKLPGVCGGSCPSGGADVTGRGGWSMRLMWRAGGSGEEYAYILPAQRYGTDLGLGAWTFASGEWHRVAQQLVLNAAGAADGESRVWFDVDPARDPTFEAKDLTYRRDDTPADTLFFSTFFGGHDAGWATPVNTFVEFARFVVCR
jgi:hypothetical protein